MSYQCEGCGKTSRIAQHAPGCPVAAQFEAERARERETDSAHEIASSIARNSKALLLEVAPFALHGLELAIFKAALEEPARRGGRVVELCALKAKLKDWQEKTA